MKQCKICGETKPTEDFVLDRMCVGGRKGYCRPCRNQRKRKRYHTDPVFKKKERDKHKCSMYDINMKELHALRERCDNSCMICGVADDEYALGLHIDHCHDTGVVRGLLCSPCNVGLGQFKDSKDLLSVAMSYLESNQ